MRRLLAAVALLAFLPTANAQDKAKGDMSHGGELRIRDSWFINPDANKNAGGHKNDLMERFKLDLGFKANEKLSATVTLLNNFAWGRAAGTTLNVPDGSANASDFLTVNQAYANWMTSDDFSIKAGRMNYQIADGTLISRNEWEAVPYAFEGLLGNYEAEFGRIQAFAFKYRELGTAGTTNSDPERNAYGLNFDLKTMPEVLKAVNVHVLKDSSDSVATGTVADGLIGRDMMRYGLNVNLMFAMVDLKLWYEGMAGKYITQGASTKQDATGSMMQAELGANFPTMMGSRIFLKYHSDTGNKDSSSTTDKSTAYDPYFHEQHCMSGCMDLLDWGNLTFVQIGANVKPMDSTEVGLSYYMFTKTSKGGTATVTRPASTETTRNYLTKGANADKDQLGSEVDLWAEHHYNSSLTNTIRLGQFMPGDVYKANGATQKDSITQVFLEAKMTF